MSPFFLCPEGQGGSEESELSELSEVSEGSVNGQNNQLEHAFRPKIDSMNGDGICEECYERRSQYGVEW